MYLMAAETNEKEPFPQFSPVEPPVASLEEISAAIEGLSNAELVRLERYARYRIRGLGRKSGGRDHEDLLRDAMTSTLAGNRRWKKETVDFFTHLVGVMRSLSSHWAEQFIHTEADPVEFDTLPSTIPDAERVVSAKQELGLIESYFASDPVVPAIIDGLRNGMTGEEIQNRRGLTRTQFESGVRRMRRGIAQMQRERIN